MASTFADIITQARYTLLESTESFWDDDDELLNVAIRGAKDLWRDIVDLKGEHYLTVEATNVYIPANTSTIAGIPTDIHKIYLIEPRDTGSTSAHRNLAFTPLDYNDARFIAARSRDAVDPSTYYEIFYAITGQGAPASPPVIYIAPQVSGAVNLRFAYVPTLAPMVAASEVPIPGEADNALVAWTIAFARAKERDDRSPDPNWLAVYATEKAHLLNSLGLRQYQEPQRVEDVFAEYW